MPRRLARYLLTETFTWYVLGVAACCLLLSIDFLAVWARFLIEQNATVGTVGKLMLYKLPWFLHLSLPVAVVFAVLFATGRMARDSELKASYALGASPIQLLVPLVLFGLLVSLASLVNNGFLEPVSEVSYGRVVDSFFYTRPPAEVQTNVSYILEDGGVYFAARVRADEENRELATLSGILVMLDDGTILTAPQGTWASDRRMWELQEVERLPPGEEPIREDAFTLPFDLPSSAADTLSRSETLTLTALWGRLQEVRNSGGATSDLAFSLHRRLADATSAAVFVLIAGSLGLFLRNRSAGFAWTIVLLVLFWALWTLSGNLFERGVLGPSMAAWLTPGLVAATGVGFTLWRFRT